MESVRVRGDTLAWWRGVAAVLAWLGMQACAAAPCPAGTVPRGAAAADNVCVAPDSRRRVAGENARAPLLWVAGAFGIKTCASGFVWREAFVGDTTCVTPDIRTLTLAENAGPRGDPVP